MNTFFPEICSYIDSVGVDFDEDDDNSIDPPLIMNQFLIKIHASVAENAMHRIKFHKININYKFQ